ncbi:hypothetical protein WDU94_004511 [Cyamophila willieti]
MTTSSEDVLLQVSNVRHKKGDGTLYVMSERIGFMTNNSDTMSSCYAYTDVKMQKISSEQKQKVQLQLVFHSGESVIFQFVCPSRSDSVTNRDAVKGYLTKLLPKFQKKVNKELEEKNRMLSSNAALFQLYRDLVITKIVDAEEFWSQHAPAYINKNGASQQQIGVPGNFLVNVKPQTDGCNAIKYNLTADTIECIFRTYPAVRQKHLEYVPHKLSESEFWVKFFQSHYFHKDRMHTGTKDLFSECAKHDDQELKKELSTVEQCEVNLNAFDNTVENEGYGLDSTEASTGSNNIVSENLIKRFNHHSIMVLKATRNNTEQLETESGSARKKIRLLNEDESCELGDGETKKIEKTNINLSKVEQMINGVKNPKTKVRNLHAILHKANSMRDKVCYDILHYRKPPGTTYLTPSAAVSALGELTPGGLLMNGLLEDSQSLAQLVPSDIEKEFRSLYLTICELLRHFWACFPPTTPTLEEKLVRMYDALRKFHQTKLNTFENRIMVECSTLNQQLTAHLNLILNTAYEKYNNWQSKRKFPAGVPIN